MTSKELERIVSLNQISLPSLGALFVVANLWYNISIVQGFVFFPFQIYATCPVLARASVCFALFCTCLFSFCVPKFCSIWHMDISDDNSPFNLYNSPFLALLVQHFLRQIQFLLSAVFLQGIVGWQQERRATLLPAKIPDVPFNPDQIRVANSYFFWFDKVLICHYSEALWACKSFEEPRKRQNSELFGFLFHNVLSAH